MATHGRSFWILDDLTPLHQMHDDLFAASRYLLKPRDVVRTPPHITASWGGTPGGKNYHVTSGQNATFYIDELETGHVPQAGHRCAATTSNAACASPTSSTEAAVGEASLTITRRRRRTRSRRSPARSPPRRRIATGCTSPPTAGMNSFQWPMTYPSGVKMVDTEFHKRPADRSPSPAPTTPRSRSATGR